MGISDRNNQGIAPATLNMNQVKTPQHSQTDQQCVIVLNTCPDKDTATSVASALIQQHLAACVNILPGLTSIFHWQGQIESSEEVLLLIKTTQTAYDAVQATICDIHPYELPEIIAVPINAGLPAYLAWIGINVENSVEGKRTTTEV